MVVNLKASNLFERTETLVRYYRDIRKYNLLTIEEEKELFKLLKNGTKKEKEYAREKIINCNQRFVVSVAKFFGTNDNILDLINEGNIGLMEAINSFDETKEVKFSSYAIWYIRRAINLYCINYGNVVKKTNLSQTYHIISQATNKFIQKEFRNPSIEELRDILKNDYNINIKNINDIIDTKVLSIDKGFNSEDDEDSNIGDMNLYNSYSSNTNIYENTANNEFNDKLVSSLLKKLTPREQEIIKMVFGIGYDREYELQEISKKVGLTTERVRQLKSSILEKLNSEYKKIKREL